MIAPDVHDLAEHERRLRDADHYRPELCARCWGQRLHVHDRPQRLLLEESYRRDVVNLTIARGYVKKLSENAKVVKYLAAKHADLLTEFQGIQAASLDA